MILLSNNSVSTTIKLTEEIAFPSLSHLISHGIIMPVVTTILYIFAFPYLERRVVKFWSERQKEIKNEKLSAESEILLTPEEGMALRKAIREIVSQHQTELSEKNLEIQTLQKEISLLTAELNTLKQIDEPLEPSLTQEELDILSVFSSETGHLLESKIFKIVNMPHIRTQHILDSLVKKGFLSEGMSYQQGKYFKLTSAGRSVLVINKIV